MINWWFEKGISGFRIDAIINIKKNLDFPSFPADGDDGLVSCDKMLASAHGIGTFLEEMKHETFDKYDAFTVGEVFHLKEDELREFIGEDGHFSTKFDFSAHVLSYGEHGWYDAPALDFNRWRTALFDTQKADLTVGFEANIIENHDEPRGATHYLPAHARNETGVKMLAATYFLLRGIPFIYQGQEIGMTNCVRNDISEYDDISTKDQYQAALNAGCSKEAALHACYENSRDNARTPMQWDNSLHGGFTTGTPWLAENPNKGIQADRMVTADGSEVVMDIQQANYLNENGVVTALNFFNGFVSWGNYTACYPANTDVTDYFYCINRMFKWVAKTLILTYWNYIDRGIKRRLIDAVVQSINDWLASLATDEKIIGGRVEFNESENSTSQLAAGIVRFHIYMTPPSPMQKMDFVLEYDLSYLAALVAA